MPVARLYELIRRPDLDVTLLLKSIGFGPGFAPTVLRVREQRRRTFCPEPRDQLIALRRNVLGAHLC